MTLESYGLRPEFPEVIDSSMLRDFVDCPSLFYLRHVLGLKKRWRIPTAEAHFDWGTMWHALMETLDKTNDPNKALAKLSDFPDSLGSNDPKGRTVQRMAKMFFEYVKTYREDDLNNFEFLRGEQFFDVYNEELNLRWAGRVDKVSRRVRNGKVVVWDYKTSSRMGDSYFDTHYHGFQMPGYVWAMNQVFTDPVEEVTVDVAYCVKTKFEFFRRTFRYTPHEIAEWVNNTKLILEQMQELGEKHLHEPDKWIKNWNHCTRWGTCQFADVHWTPPIGDTRLRILRDDYREERWDPRVEEDDA